MCASLTFSVGAVWWLAVKVLKIVFHRKKSLRVRVVDTNWCRRSLVPNFTGRNAVQPVGPVESEMEHSECLRTRVGPRTRFLGGGSVSSSVKIVVLDYNQQ